MNTKFNIKITYREKLQGISCFSFECETLLQVRNIYSMKESMRLQYLKVHFHVYKMHLYLIESKEVVCIGTPDGGNMICMYP